MGDANPIRILVDYSKPSHEGYRNTIELPDGNNVFFPPGRTAELQNNILMFQQRQDKSLYDAWTYFKYSLLKVPHHGLDLWLQVQIFYDHVECTTKMAIDYAAGGRLRKLRPEVAWETIEDLAQYEEEGWNDPVVPEEESLDYENPDLEQLLGVMECKVGTLMENAISLMGWSESVFGMSSNMMRQLPPEPSSQEAFEDLVMNFILDQEERVKQLEEYMGVIGSDFMQLSLKVVEKLKDEIRAEENKVKKIEKITRKFFKENKNKILSEAGDGVRIYPDGVIFDEKKLGSRKAHLLEDKQIPSVGVFDEVFSTWMTFGGNTRDLISFREETDKTTYTAYGVVKLRVEVLMTPASKMPRQAARGPSVGLKPNSNFVYRPIQPPKTSGKKKQYGFTTQEVSNLNPFNVLNMVENDDDLGTNGGNSKLAEKGSISNVVDDPVNTDSDSEVKEAFNETTDFMASTSSKIDNSYKNGSGVVNKNMYEKLREAYIEDPYDDDDIDDCGLTEDKLNIANDFDISLQGLYEVYAPIRSIILTIDPIPDVKGAFVTLSRDESHRMDVSKPNMIVGHPNGTKALVTHVGSFKMRMKPSDKITPLKDITPMVANMSIKGRIILMWHGHRQNEQHNPYSLEFVLQDDELFAPETKVVAPAEFIQAAIKKLVGSIREIELMTGFTSWELTKKYGINPSAYFPDELNGITGKKIMFRVLYSEYNYTNNSHVYRCEKVFDDEEIVSYWKKGFGTLGEDTQDEYTTSANSTKYSKLLDLSLPRSVNPWLLLGLILMGHGSAGMGQFVGKVMCDIISSVKDTFACGTRKKSEEDTKEPNAKRKMYRDDEIGVDIDNVKLSCVAKMLRCLVNETETAKCVAPVSNKTKQHDHSRREFPKRYLKS
ncbi:hypothetical protein Tco_1404819 [Tanacetum coccineum]